MATLKLSYVHSFVDRTGHVRHYFRYRGQHWPLPGQPGTSAFTARYDELREQCLATRQASNITFGPSTLGYVMEKYLASADFTSKAIGTQRHYRTSLDRLKEICGRALIGDLREKHIRELRKRFTATSKADLAVMLLRMLWSFAKENLAMDIGANPATEIRNSTSAIVVARTVACDSD